MPTHNPPAFFQSVRYSQRPAHLKAPRHRGGYYTFAALQYPAFLAYNELQRGQGAPRQRASRLLRRLAGVHLTSWRLYYAHEEFLYESTNPANQ